RRAETSVLPGRSRNVRVSPRAASPKECRLAIGAPAFPSGALPCASLRRSAVTARGPTGRFRRRRDARSGAASARRVDGAWMTKTQRSRKPSEPARSDVHASLDKLFRPRSVAVIGASRRPGSIGWQVLHNLITGGFEGKVFPVNPNAEVLHSIK